MLFKTPRRASAFKEKCVGHYCWMCGRMRPNEAFSGRGRIRHLCKRCSRRPREERESIRAMMDMEGFLEQKNISAKNIARLRDLCESPDEDVRRRAEIILEVALIKPHRRKRRRYLYENRPDIFARLVEEYLFVEWGEDEEADYHPGVEEWAGAGAPGGGSVANQEAIEEIAAEPFENGSYDELPF